MFSSILICIIGILHIGFFLLESYLYTTKLGHKTFKLNQEKIKYTKIWAFNQGYYNLCLGLGLIVSVFLHDVALSNLLLVYVIIVGIAGGASSNRWILYLQCLPAILAMILLWRQ